LSTALQQTILNSQSRGFSSNELSRTYSSLRLVTLCYICFLDDTLISYFQIFDNRGNRVEKLHLISDLAQAMGHMEHKPLINARNILLRSVPNTISGIVFDKFIEFSS
jgi:hypothetical protein